MNFLYSLFLSPDEAVSKERVRNEIAREKLSRARLQRKSEEEIYENNIKLLEGELHEKRETLAAAAKPLLEEFDDVSLAQHYYQEVSNIASSHLHIVTQLAERELSEFGYIGKKIISVGLNSEALRLRMTRGLSFRKELLTTLHDADSEDLNIIAEPLQDINNIPPDSAVRVTAFDLARAIEETGKEIIREPVRSWLDLFKFRTSFSPTMIEMQQVRARRAAKEFLTHIEKGEYHSALSMAEDIFANANRDKVSNLELLESAFKGFKDTVLPTIASDIFLRYTKASLDASRFACVENMLKE